MPNSERRPPEMNLFTDFCFLTSVPLLSRGWIVPVGGSTPDRHKTGTRSESSTPVECLPAMPNSERCPPEMNLFTDFCFLTSVPLLSRGWIVPVGGATPDRLRSAWTGMGRTGTSRGKKKAPAFAGAFSGEPFFHAAFFAFLPSASETPLAYSGSACSKCASCRFTMSCGTPAIARAMFSHKRPR